MIPVSFPEANIILSKPASMPDEQCMQIVGYRGIDEDGHPYILTMWQPNKEDIEAIQSGRPVFLKLVGESMQPACLFTLDENNEVN